MSETVNNSRSLTGWIPWVLLVVSFLGFADAAYLSAEFFSGTVPPCTLITGCEVVMASQYASVQGVPVALLGALFYLSIFILTLAHLGRRSLFPLKTVAYLSIPGFLFTLWLVYLQLFILHAICLYCMFSAIMDTGIFVLSMIFLYRYKHIPAPM